ncbi:MAG TPA: hypothetical protein PLH13_04220 [Burkholderiaceae bacterium]|nr:hypothetical protein [Burkholderiaceae bacterium]
MLLTFSTEAAKNDAFSLLLASFAILISIVCAVTVLVQRSKPAGWPATEIMITGFVIYFAIVVVSFFDTYSEFVSAKIESTGVDLIYVGPYGREVNISRERIETVLFGIPGKSIGKCYLKIVEKSGKSRRSSTFTATPEVCKNMRADVISKLLH